jgi:predicted metal-binding membrane protein
VLAPAREAPSALERLVRRDRLLTMVGLAATTAVAWTYLVRAAESMNAMTLEAQMHAAMGMADMHAWGASDWLGLFSMWAVMMVAMMLPSAAPVILLVLGVYRRRSDRLARLSAIAFVAGYVLAWTAFSAGAAAAQVGLHRAALLAPDMRLSSVRLSGIIFVVAGTYQWLPLKNTCLTHCRSPFGFLSRYWREGAIGGLVMGVRHGGFCVGCCWLLMALLFVVGVMNLLWVAALGAFVLVEKLVRGGAALGRVAGVAVASWGIYLLASTWA